MKLVPAVIEINPFSLPSSFFINFNSILPLTPTFPSFYQTVSKNKVI